MKKLLLICFGLLTTVVCVLSFINYSYDSIDKIEQDKQLLNIAKPADMPNKSFLVLLETTAKELRTDIMFRNVDVTKSKTLYSYYKTSNNSQFISVMDERQNKMVLSESNQISTIGTKKKSKAVLKVASAIQDITFSNLIEAEKYTLTTGIYYIDQRLTDSFTQALSKAGVKVEVETSAMTSGKLPVIIFIIIPIFLMLMSTVFYGVNNAKRTVLKKMDGYSTLEILREDLASIGKQLLTIAIVISTIVCVIALFYFRGAFINYLLFFLGYLFIVLATAVMSLLVNLFIIHRQNKVEYVKGRVPKKSVYYLSMIGKSLFMVLSLVFMSMAVRNVTILYQTFQTSKGIAEKVEGYVTLPIYNNNQSERGLEEQYFELYKETVDKYKGILINASNYEVDVQSGQILADKVGQDNIEVNVNYLDFNPIYQINGSQVTEQTLSDQAVNILIPETKLNKEQEYGEKAREWFKIEPNFVTYDDRESKIYSYNATTSSNGNGLLDSPIIFVLDEQLLAQTPEFLLSFCSKGQYIINPGKNKPYEEVKPLLQELGIEKITPELPDVASTFSTMMNDMLDMFKLYGSQTLFLSIGLVCLIVFSSRVYCENFQRKIAYSLIEGARLVQVIRKHITFTVVTYVMALVLFPIMFHVISISPNYYLLVGCFVVEMTALFYSCKKYAGKNIYEVVKGAE